MPTSMLSSLARGYGTWTGSFDTIIPPQNDGLPSLKPAEHRHGITITPRSRTPYNEVSIADDGHIEIPKTFVTRKGALMLFTAPGDIPQEPTKTPSPTPKYRKRKPKSVIDLSLKLKTIERLSLSILQYGDQSYDKESASISDKDNPLVMNFLHHLEEAERDDADIHSQPGGDLKFYLRDLKRRASCWSQGGGERGGVHKARSAELQEILDQLEKAWPQSQREESIYGGSAPGGEEFFYPVSPSPSIATARSSRSKVLSSQKLTASLKSLNYLGRPASTEPEFTSLRHDNLRQASEYRYGRSKSARSAVWVTDASTPIYLRPRVTQESTIFRDTSAPQRPLVPSPAGKEPRDYPDGVGDSQTPVWINEESRDNTSLISDDFQSRDDTFDLDIRVASERGDVLSRATSVKSDPRPYTPIKSERSLTPVRDERLDLERSQMLSEAASALSSLVEEEDQILPPEPVYQVADGEEFEEQNQWPGGEQVMESRASSRQTGRESAKNRSIASRGATPSAYSVGEDADEEAADNGGVTAVYVTAGTAPADDSAQAEPVSHTDIEIEQKSDFDQAKLLSDKADELKDVEHPPQSLIIDAYQDTKVEVIGKESLESTGRGTPAAMVTKVAVDPDTLVSMQTGKQKDEGIRKEEPSPKSELMKEEATASPSALKQSPSTEGPVAAPSMQTPKVDSKDAVVEEEEDLVSDKIPVTPRRRERPPEKRQSLIPDVEAEPEQEDTTDGEPKLSERVIKEREERELRAAQKKEEQEKEAAAKQAEEDRQKQEAEDKKMAAEMRLKQRAEEAAKRKEEERKKKEEEIKLTPQPDSKDEKASKKEGKKADKKSSKKGASDTAMKADSALEKLKAKSASGGEVDVDKLKQYMATQPPPPRPKMEKENVEVPDHLKEMFERKSKSKGQLELEEEIGKMQMAADQALGGSVLDVDASEGLSAEDFASAQEALMEKIKRAEEEILDGGKQAPPTPKPPSQPKPKQTTPRTPKGPPSKTPGKKSPPPKRKKDPEAEKKQEQARKKAEVKEQQRLEKERRLEEAKALQEKIKSKEEVRKAKEAEAKRKAEELQERMEAIKQEEEEIEQAEQDARAQLAAVRKAQREEREARRKADLEKKKQDAIEKREKEKAMIEAARLKEQEMLDRIADAEMARRLREEEEAKREEEEMLAQERFEREMKEAQRLAEEEEEKLRDLERQAEEEAFQRLLEEREAAEERRWELEEQARVMREESEKAQREMMEEEARLDQEKRQKEAEEEARREQERARLIELQRLEEEARDKMRAQLEQRRAWALRRREQNLASRANLDAMRQSQGITEPWTFSYFVRWPKDSYNRPMGQDPKKQRGFSPKKPVKPPPADAPATNTTSAADVSLMPS